MIGLAGHASAARTAGAVWRAAMPATAMAMERARRATRCLMLDFNYVSFFGMPGNPLAGLRPELRPANYAGRSLRGAAPTAAETRARAIQCAIAEPAGRDDRQNS
ncbi:protein of unknown function [Cupriavidus taiwanensis]|nr:protein of unknown function [Cupriavidus taiwanensis]